MRVVQLSTQVLVLILQLPNLIGLNKCDACLLTFYTTSLPHVTLSCKCMKNFHFKNNYLQLQFPLFLLKKVIEILKGGFAFFSTQQELLLLPSVIVLSLSPSRRDLFSHFLWGFPAESFPTISSNLSLLSLRMPWNRK